MEPAAVIPPVVDGIINAEPAPGDVKNEGKWAQPADGSTAIIQL